MGNCMRKPMSANDERNLLSAAKGAMEPSFANDEDAVDLGAIKRQTGMHESALGSLANKASAKNNRDDDDDDRYPSRGRGGRRGRYSDEEDDDDDRRRRHRSRDDGSDDEDGGRRRGARGSRRRDDDDEDDDDGPRLHDRRRNGSRGRPIDYEDDEQDARSKGRGGGKPTNPFADDDDDGVKSTRGAAGRKAAAATNPFEDDDNTDARSTRSNATNATRGTAATAATRATSAKPAQDDDFASIKSRGSQATAGAKRPPFEGITPTGSFAADARALRNAQLSTKPGAVSDSDSDEDDKSTSHDNVSMTSSTGPAPARPKLTQFGQLKKKICSLKVEVEYNLTRQALAVHLHDVEGLSERKYGKPNLYVKLYLSPDPKRRTKRKTNVIEKNAAPDFDERFEYKVPATEIGSKSLRLALWEQGSVANSVMGELSIGFNNYALKGAFSFNEYFAIARRTRHPVDRTVVNPTAAISGPEDDGDDSDDAKSVRSVRSYVSNRNPFGSDDDEDADTRSVMSTGSVIMATPKPTQKGLKSKKLCNIHLAVGYNALEGLLRVHVQELGELPWKEETKPDLYIKMFVAPDPKKETKRKTRVVNANLAPKYDELFEWPVPTSEIKSKSLIVSLCEEGTLSNDILGEVSIGFSNFDGDFEWNDWFAINRKSFGQGRLSLNKRFVAKTDVREYTPEDPSDSRSVHSNEEVIKPALTEEAAKKVALAYVKLDISYEAVRGTFKVVVHKLKGLDKHPALDLYLKLWVQPDYATTNRETQVKRNVKTPFSLKEEFEWTYAVGEVQRKSLVIQLWHDVTLAGLEKNKNKLIGQVTIGFKSTEGANFAWSDWYALFEKKK